MQILPGGQPRLAGRAVERDRILAAIDVGTNSIHMVVVQIKPDLPSFTIIDTEKETVRLGQRDPKTGGLTLAAMERSLAALKRCLEVARACNAEQTIAVATSAVREAPNGRDFIEAVEAELGLKINLISGQEEARRIYLGVLSGMEFNHLPHVIIDIGGGSTELILGDGHEPRYLSSTKVGAVRLTQDFVTTDPISDLEFERLRAYVRGMLEWPIGELRSHLLAGEQPRLVGTSGTIESLITLHAHATLGAPPASLHGYGFSLEDLSQLTQRLRKLNFSDRAQMLGMSERRAEIILAGAVVLQEAMGMLGLAEIIACERALREGMIVDWMLSHGLIEDRLRYQSSVRQRSVLNLAQKYQVHLENAERVATFALTLFDQSQGQLHHWGPRERELLWAAGILHNCGHYVSHSAHHKHSYYLIRNGELLGYTDGEIETIANLARYHRKSPPKKKHENYQNLTGKAERQIVEQLSAILRLASALDRRRSGAIQALDAKFNPQTREYHLWLQPAQAADDCALELWSLDYKKAWFETIFDVKLTAALQEVVPVRGGEFPRRAQPQAQASGRS